MGKTINDPIQPVAVARTTVIGVELPALGNGLAVEVPAGRTLVKAATGWGSGSVWALKYVL